MSKLVVSFNYFLKSTCVCLGSPNAILNPQQGFPGDEGRLDQQHRAGKQSSVLRAAEENAVTGINGAIFHTREAKSILKFVFSRLENVEANSILKIK